MQQRLRLKNKKWKLKTARPKLKLISALSLRRTLNTKKLLLSKN